MNGWTIWQKNGTSDHYRNYSTKAEAIKARVKLLNDWRASGSGRTATKHFPAGRAWTEVDGWDLRERERGQFGSQVVSFLNLFPTRDR